MIACRPRGLVEQIRKRVHKHDAFARMEKEKERERQQRSEIEAEKRKVELRRRDELEQVRCGINALFNETNPQRRGNRRAHLSCRSEMASESLPRQLTEKISS
jgi:hypothetical protein